MGKELERLTSTAVAAYQPPSTSTDTTVSSRTMDRIAASIPETTRSAYAGDWKRFAGWCERESGRTALPATPETLAEYASYLADQGRAPATIMRAMSSIRVIHELGGHPSPSTLPARAVVKTYRGERADDGLPNRRPAAALTVDQLRKAAAALDPDDIRHLRDRVILVLGWSMMARRATLTRLNIADIVTVEAGIDVTVRRAKADQMAEGRIVAVPYGSDPTTCPARLTLAWIAALAARSITSGPLIRYIDRHGRIAGQPGVALAGKPPAPDGRLSGHSIRDIVRRTGLVAGLPTDRLTAHSVRAGGATGAWLGGADMLSIARHGGWVDGSAELFKYIRDVDRWVKNPMYGAGL